MKKLLAVPGVRFRSLAESPQAPTVRETGRTCEANAIKKARAVAKATGLLAIADDSGLEVEALRWGPGVRSARFAGAHGDDAANNAALLRRLRAVASSARRARYRCVLALAGPAHPDAAGGASPSRLLAVTRGAWEGRIAQRPAGHRGFGYDPLFLLPRFGKTVAQLPASVKQRLSHRALAARRMRPVLRRVLAAQVSGRRR